MMLECNNKQLKGWPTLHFIVLPTLAFACPVVAPREVTWSGQPHTPRAPWTSRVGNAIAAVLRAVEQAREAAAEEAAEPDAAAARHPEGRALTHCTARGCCSAELRTWRAASPGCSVRALMKMMCMMSAQEWHQLLTMACLQAQSTSAAATAAPRATHALYSCSPCKPLRQAAAASAAAKAPAGRLLAGRSAASCWS